MPELTTTATTDSVRMSMPAENVIYVQEHVPGQTYTVVPHPPSRREDSRDVYRIAAMRIEAGDTIAYPARAVLDLND